VVACCGSLLHGNLPSEELAVDVVMSERRDSDQCHHRRHAIQGSVRSAQAPLAQTRLLQG
jgi:hypothetical protein